jgi:hypothetical protein
MGSAGDARGTANGQATKKARLIEGVGGGRGAVDALSAERGEDLRQHLGCLQGDAAGFGGPVALSVVRWVRPAT